MWVSWRVGVDELEGESGMSWGVSVEGELEGEGEMSWGVSVEGECGG